MANGFVVCATLIVGAAAAFFAYGLNAYGLLDNNEGMYALIGREMLASGDYVIPTLNGVPYVEKPPLLYYLLAGAFALFGESEITARLVPLAAGAAQLALMLWFGYRVGQRRTAALAALVLMTSLGFYLMSRLVMFDMLFSMLLNGALLCFWLALRTARPAYQRIGLALLALAVLTKGLVAVVLYGLVVVAYAATSAAPERRAIMRMLADRGAAALFIAVVLPWHAAAAWTDPDFFRFYFIEGQLFRFFGIDEQADYYTGTVFYYLPRVALMLMPWTLFLALPWWSSGSNGRMPPLTRFLLLAFAMPMAFFSLSVAKANYYLIVGLPPLAWLVAQALVGLDSANVRRRALTAALAPAVVLGAFLVFLGAGPLVADRADLLRNTTAFSRPANAEFLENSGLMYIAMIAVGLCAVLAVIGVYRRQSWAVIASTAGVGAIAALLVVRMVMANDAHLSSRDVVHVVRPALDRAEVVLYKDLEEISSLPFYLGRPVGILDSDSGDLAYAQRKGTYRETFLSAEDIAKHAARMIVVVRDSDLDEFRVLAREHSLPLEPWYRFANGVTLFGPAKYAQNDLL